MTLTLDHIFQEHNTHTGLTHHRSLLNNVGYVLAQVESLIFCQQNGVLKDTPGILFTKY